MKQTWMRHIGVAALAVSLGACARPPIYTVTSNGTLPQGTSSYGLVAAEDEAPSPVTAKVQDALKRQGLAPAPDANLLLYVGSATRPGKSGVFTSVGETGAADPKAEPAWSSAPSRKRKFVTSLSLSFVDRGTGEAVRTARAEVAHNKPLEPAMMTKLAQDAANLQPAPPPAR